jgi:hypothetical protein
MSWVRTVTFFIISLTPNLLWADADLTVTDTRCIVPAEFNHGTGKILQQQFARANDQASILGRHYRDTSRSPDFKLHIIDPIESLNAAIPDIATPAQVQAAEEQIRLMLVGKSHAVLNAWKDSLIAGKFPEDTDIGRSLDAAFAESIVSIQNGVDAKTMYSAGADPQKETQARIHDGEAFVGQMKAIKSAFEEFLHFFPLSLEKSCPGVPLVSFEIENADKEYQYKNCGQVPGSTSGPFKTDAACSFSIHCEGVTAGGTNLEGVNAMVFGLSCAKEGGKCPGLVACAKQAEGEFESPGPGTSDQASPAK